MQPPLLSLSDFKARLEVPEGLEFIRLKTHILEAQGQWLEDPLQGSWPGLYLALSAGVLAQAAAQLARAAARKAQAGQLPPLAPLPALAPLQEPLASLWEEAQPMLVFASYASYLPFSTSTLTAHSLVEHTSDYSTRVSDPSISKQVTTVTGWAQRYQGRLTQRLQELAPVLQAYSLQSRCQAEPTNLNQGTVAWLPIRNRRR